MRPLQPADLRSCRWAPQSRRASAARCRLSCARARADVLWLVLVVCALASRWRLIVDYAGQRRCTGAMPQPRVATGFLTLTRVIVLIALASLIWVPIGVWIGLRPRVAERVQPIAQFLAAFPANVLFPDRGGRHRDVSARSGHLAQPADDPRHPVVHPVQRHCRRQGVADRSARGPRQFPRAQAGSGGARSCCPASCPTTSPGR